MEYQQTQTVWYVTILLNNVKDPILTYCKSDTRIYIWLILLDAPPINTDIYIDLVHQGSSPAYSKIRNDTFRTLATDPLFRRRVSENSLTRVLNAVAWKLHDAHEARINGWLSPPTMSVASGMGGDLGASMPTSPPGSRGGNDALQSLSSLHSDAGGGGGAAGGGTTNGSQAGEKMDYVGYVQGMNVLAAPFLYVARSEAEAFAAFDKFIRTECPGYIRGSMEGVHRGLALVDEALQICDPKLFQYLSSKRLHASIYAFPSVLTMCACTPPLPEVLQLWDFLFAYGMHLNILCIVAQLVLIRDQILSAERYVSLFTIIDCDG